MTSLVFRAVAALVLGIATSYPAGAAPITLTMSGSATMLETFNLGTPTPGGRDDSGNFTFMLTGDTNNFSASAALLSGLTAHFVTTPTATGGIAFNTDLQTSSARITDALGFVPSMTFMVPDMNISGENVGLTGYRFDRSLGPIPLTLPLASGVLVLPPFNNPPDDVLTFSNLENVTFTSTVGGGAAGVPEPASAVFLGTGLLMLLGCARRRR